MTLLFNTKDDFEVSTNDEKSLDIMEYTQEDRCLTRTGNNVRERMLGKNENVLTEGKLKWIKMDNKNNKICTYK